MIGKQRHLRGGISVLHRLGHRVDRAQRGLGDLAAAARAGRQVRTPEMQDVGLGMRPHVILEHAPGRRAEPVPFRERANITARQQLSQQVPTMLDRHSALTGKPDRPLSALAPCRLGRAADRLGPRADVDNTQFSR